MANTERGAPRAEGAVGHQQLGAQVRAERQRRALSVRELARRIGVSASLVSQVETGRAQPSVTTLMALVTELELSLDSRSPMGRNPGGRHPQRRSVRQTLEYRRRPTRLRSGAPARCPASPGALISTKKCRRLSRLSPMAHRGLTMEHRGLSRPARRLLWGDSGSRSGWREWASAPFWSSSLVSAGSA